jgi:ferric-dicitrate binding protein FerR (iron transport regulator)
MEAKRRRFAVLLRLALDDAFTDAETEEFAELQQEYPEMLLEHIDTISTHGLLYWQSEDLAECMLLEEAAEARDEAARYAESHTARSRKLWLAAAAVLAVTTGLLAWQYEQRGFAPHEPIANITSQEDVTWAHTSTALGDNRIVSAGTLQNSSGSYTLEFRSGPTVRIAGSSSLNVKSAMLIQLDRGQATARVPEACKGFAIKTPVARVVDQGTEFGVVARQDGKTDVIVFEGRVDVRDMAGPKRGPQSLLIGGGARIDAQGTMDRIVQVGRNTSGSWWTDDLEAGSHQIANISDNIMTDVSDKFVCYQTTYGGLQDDALAYADNPNHQWNGLTSEGLPEFLRGADYVKTFNDYRYRQDFAMTVVLSKPTNLYVFADNRIPPPPWLQELFEDTGVDIGLDEGPWLDQAEEKFRKLDVNRIAVGGGNSVDNTFSIWLRLCTEPGPVKLGDAGKWATEGSQGRAMYGIAATPLDDIQ